MNNLSNEMIYLPPLKSLSIFRFIWLRNLVTRDDEKKNVAKQAKKAWFFLKEKYFSKLKF